MQPIKINGLAKWALKQSLGGTRATLVIGFLENENFPKLWAAFQLLSEGNTGGFLSALPDDTFSGLRLEWLKRLGGAR